jgi:hypothetical protein
MNAIAAATLSALLWAANAAPPPPLTVEEVVKQRDAGTAEAELLKAIERQGVSMETTAESFAKLKDSKFSEALEAAVRGAAVRRAILTGKLLFAARGKPCAQCGSRGFLPCPKHGATDFIITSQDKDLPPCCAGLAWLECPACGDIVTKTAIEELKRWLARRMAWWKEMDKGLGHELFHGETRHFALDTDLPARDAPKLAVPCEETILKLQTLFRCDAFGVTGPLTTRLISVDKVATFTRFFEWAAPNMPPEQKQKLTQSASLISSGPSTLAIHARERRGGSTVYSLVHALGHSIIHRYTGADERLQLPAWITEGFSSFCEALQLKQPVCWCIDYDPKTITPGVQWKEAVRTAAQAGKTVPLEMLLTKRLTELKALDYQQSWSVTSALIYGGPDKYLKFLDAIKARNDQVESLEKAYNCKINQIELIWRNYAASQ